MLKTFQLKNYIGQTYDLTSDSILNSLSGFGYTDGATYMQLGSKNIRLKRKLDIPKPSGTINLMGSTKSEVAQKYHELIKFLQYEPLTLIYNPFGTEYEMACNIASIDYSEPSGNLIQAKVTFAALCRFHQVKTSATTSATATGFTFDTSVFDNNLLTDNGLNRVKIVCDSKEECSGKLTIYGPATNPQWTIYLNGNEVGKGKINYTVSNTNKIVVDNTQSPAVVAEYQANTNEYIKDLYQNLDFTKLDWPIELGEGTNEIYVTDDNGTGINLMVEGHIEYASV